jgi:hypothetical protein
MEFRDDIVAFNEWVRGKLDTLNRRGQESSDLITHLLSACHGLALWMTSSDPFASFTPAFTFPITL